MKIGYKVAEDKNSRFLTPEGFSGEINVVNDMDWTISPKFARKDAPRAYLTEYQQTAGSLVASILMLSRLIQNTNSVNDLITASKDPADVYKFKYLAEPTGFSYVFPYFNEKRTTRQTTFDYEDGQSPFAPLMNIARERLGFGRGGALSFIGGAIDIGRSVGGVINSILPGKLSLEHPRSWNDTNAGEYTFTFDLFNTTTSDAIINNRNLAHILTYQQSPNRRNAVITDPVCIYDLYIPDVIHFPSCYMSNLDIKNLGNTRLLNLNGVSRIIPEAYRFTMSFQSLLMPSRNIEIGADAGKKVQAIEDVRNITDFISAIQNNDSEGALSSYIQIGNQQGTSPEQSTQDFMNLIGA